MKCGSAEIFLSADFNPITVHIMVTEGHEGNYSVVMTEMLVSCLFLQEDRDRPRGVGVRGNRADPDRLAGRLRGLRGQRSHVGHVSLLREG